MGKAFCSRMKTVFSARFCDVAKQLRAYLESGWLHINLVPRVLPLAFSKQEREPWQRGWLHMRKQVFILYWIAFHV